MIKCKYSSKFCKLFLSFIVIIISITLISCTSYNLDDNKIYGGYSEEQLIIENDDKYYISGYSGGRYFTDILDYQKVKAFYLKYNGEETMIISVDCVGLTSVYVNQIRSELDFDFPVNVISTHTHAGVDTMGLWGPAGIDGKDEDFMSFLVDCAVKAAVTSYNNVKEGILTYGYAKTEEILRDSREPFVYDENIHQLRFIPIDKTEGTRLVFYGAHAEALGGSNTKISADFPSVMANEIKTKTGDNMLYLPGAIGGLICTNSFDENDIENNMKITGEKLASYVMSIEEEDISNGKLKQAKVNFKIKLDNTLFLYYKFLGILKNKISKNIFNNSYYVNTELSVIKIDKVTLVLIPGEIFPELVWDGTITNPDVQNINKEYANPDSLIDIAKEYNIDNLIILGLANDEIGYIIPPSDFLLNEEYPYLQNQEDSNGENHYEETMSVGIQTANEIEKAFKKCLGLL